MFCWNSIFVSVICQRKSIYSEHFTDLGTVKLLDVQGKDVEVEDGVFPGRVTFTTLYHDQILFCYVDVDFYSDGEFIFYICWVYIFVT